MLWIIIPTYNERENIQELIRKLSSLPLPARQIVVIDDNSPDGTADLVRKMENKYPVKLISRPGKMGLGSAYILGFKKALDVGADYMMEMDADFSHHPDDVLKLYKACQQGADLAIGSRRIKGGKIIGWGPIRIFMSRGAMEFARIILCLKTRDVTAGFRCYRREIIEKLPLKSIKSNGYSFQEEILFLVEKMGAKIKEIPVVFYDRQQGKSKLSFWEVIKFFLVVFKLRFSYVFQPVKKNIKK